MVTKKSGGPAAASLCESAAQKRGASNQVEASLLSADASAVLSSSSAGGENPLLLRHPLPCSIDGYNAGSNKDKNLLARITANVRKGDRRIQVRSWW